MNFNLIVSLLLLSTVEAVAQQSDTVLSNSEKQLIEYDEKRPVIKIEGKLAKNENGVLRFSALTGYREGISPTRGIGSFEAITDLQNHTSRIYMINLSIENMITMGYYKSKDIVLEVKNPLKYRYDTLAGSYKEWMRKNTFCFEFLMPYAGVENVSEVIKQELGHYFGIKCTLEKRIVDALVLIRTSNIDKIKSAGKGEGYYDMKGYFNNIPISRLGHPLSDANMPPMINETGYKGNVDINLKIDSWKDLAALRKQLKIYDLDIKEEKRAVDKVIIREVN